MDRALTNIMNMICDEIERFANKPDMTSGDLEAVNKLIMTKEKILRIEEIEGNLGYSNDGDWRAEGTYQRGHSYDGSRYGKHYVGGHYSRSDRYSMDDGKGMIMDRMQAMMDDPNMSPADRASLKRAMDQLR